MMFFTEFNQLHLNYYGKELKTYEEAIALVKEKGTLRLGNKNIYTDGNILLWRY